MSLYHNILETIGNTPLVRLSQFEKKYELNNEVYAKLESFNPGNNVKIRPAYQMIRSLYDKGMMTKDTVIVEATSGNTGIGLAIVGAYYNNRVILTMPEQSSIERVQVMKHYGAEVILTPKEKGIVGSKEEAIRISESLNGIIPSQFENNQNPYAHYLTTAKELERDLPQIDYIFSGVGTGGTISGVGRYYKEKGYSTKFVAVEPEESQILKGKEKGPHKIAGISPGFVPDNYDPMVVDEIQAVSSDEAWEMTKSFVPLEAISIGISGGAALKAVVKYIKSHDIKNKKIVCIIPDSGEKYFSTGVFE